MTDALRTKMNAKRIAPDKVLLGVIVVTLVGMWIIGSMMKDEPSATNQEKAAQTQGEQAQAPAGGAAPAPAANPNLLEPNLATDFVKWWIGGAMDYGATSGQKSHDEAFRWMTADAQQAFQANFWPPELAQGIQTGQITAAFQPIAVTAQAVNPDGSVVVGLQGTLVLQANGRPVTHQIMVDYLVKRDADGLRIAGLYNRSYLVQASSPY